MKSEEWVKSLKAGDKVIRVISPTQLYIAIVDKITPSLIVRCHELHGIGQISFKPADYCEPSCTGFGSTDGQIVPYDGEKAIEAEKQEEVRKIEEENRRTIMRAGDLCSACARHQVSISLDQAKAIIRIFKEN
jgi:hypothetical protein